MRSRVEDVLDPLGGIGRFVQPGMQVLIKPNLVAGARLEQAVTTHPALVGAVVGMVQEAGGTPLLGDSPGGPLKNGPRVYRQSGIKHAAEQTGARLVQFGPVDWKHLNGIDYFISRDVLDADLVIGLPKLKTHVLTLYTGAVKNMFGTIPGTRKREVHYRAPGLRDFSTALVDVFELVRPGLSIMDGVLGQEGEGPGVGGTPRQYGCLAASTDSVALDAVMAQAMGFHPREIRHLVEAGEREMGISDLRQVRVEGDLDALNFGRVRLPGAVWQSFIPSWVAAPLRRALRIRPRLEEELCIACERCLEVCPLQAVTVAEKACFDLQKCVGCLCCAEVCPQGAIEVQRSLLARLSKIGY
jgi:uncharacterized protein (DUF362 family)/Pyruvate/2-oxoacid:ferredoxin oxidoreductase delta subunit